MGLCFAILVRLQVVNTSLIPMAKAFLNYPSSNSFYNGIGSPPVITARGTRRNDKRKA